MDFNILKPVVDLIGNLIEKSVLPSESKESTKQKSSLQSKIAISAGHSSFIFRRITSPIYSYFKVIHKEYFFFILP